jgi:hypothetical protein
MYIIPGYDNTDLSTFVEALAASIEESSEFDSQDRALFVLLALLPLVEEHPERILPVCQLALKLSPHLPVLLRDRIPRADHMAHSLAQRECQK